MPVSPLPTPGPNDTWGAELNEAIESRATPEYHESVLPERLTDTALRATVAEGLSAGLIPEAVFEAGASGPAVTNSKTGARTPITGAVSNAQTLGVGVKATIDGLERWVSPSGYPRSVDTVFRRAFLAGSSSASLMGLDLRNALTPLGYFTHWDTASQGSYQITHIAAAVGVRPLKAVAFTVPASGGVSITPTNMPEDNNGSVPISWPGSFAGVPGVLTKPAASLAWTFTRTYPGDAVTIPKDTEFLPSTPAEYQDGVAFLNVGKNTLTNASKMSLQDVMDLTEKMSDFFAGAGRHVIVLGHFQTKPWIPGTGGFERIEAYNRWAKTRFGGRFIDQQAYLDSDQVWADAGITPTAADRVAQQYPQYIPPSLARDDMHLNEAANKAIVKPIAARVAELGWQQSYNFTVAGVPAPAVTWRADSLAGQNGTKVGSWLSSGARNLTTTSTDPLKATLQNAGKSRYVRKLAGDAQFTETAWGTYGTVITLTRIGTLAAVDALAVPINLGAVTVGRYASSGNLALGAGSFLRTPSPLNTWGVVSVVLDGANSRLGWDSTVVTGDPGPNTQTGFILSRKNDGGTIDYAAVLCWTEKLTPEQVQAVVTALRAAYPELV